MSGSAGDTAIKLNGTGQMDVLPKQQSSSTPSLVFTHLSVSQQGASCEYLFVLMCLVSTARVYIQLTDQYDRGLNDCGTYNEKDDPRSDGEHFGIFQLIVLVSRPAALLFWNSLTALVILIHSCFQGKSSNEPTAHCLPITKQQTDKVSDKLVMHSGASGS